MADDLENFGRWRDSVETRLGKLESTVGEQAGLRAAMDRDMGDLKAELGAHRRLIKAIRDTQSEHTALLADHTALLADHTTRLERLETGQNKLRETLDRVHVGVDAIRNLLEGDFGSGS